MFSNRVIAELKKVVGWRNWFDPAEISPLPAPMVSTESGQYYQDYNGLVRLDYISGLIRSNQTLEDYLGDIETAAINMMLADLATSKQIDNQGKAIAQNELIYHNIVRGDTITNEGKFVGIEFSLGSNIGIKAILNRIGLYLTNTETIDLYLFNSLQPTSVAVIPYSNATAFGFQWITANIELELDKGEQSPNPDTSGGVWYLGYYQDDLAGQAIKYDKLNWKNGYCAVCDGGTSAKKYLSINKHLSMSPFYIPATVVPPQGEMFDIDNVRYDYNNNYGFNFNISIVCDLSQFLIDNRYNLRTAIGEYVAYQIIQNYLYSSEKSGLEQSVKDMAYEIINGNAATKMQPLKAKLDRVIKSVKLDQGNVNNNPCLPCARGGTEITFA